MTKTSQLEMAYEYLHDRLTRGELEPGTKLSRRKLATEIGVSPALVQHALGQLEKAGMVECRAQSGTYVRELTVEEFTDLCDMRELIEPYCAARAVGRITSSQIKILENSCQRYQECEARIPQVQTPQDAWRLHREMIDEERVFHGTIFSAAGNALITSMVHSLRLLSQVRHEFARDSLSHASIVVAQHFRIVDALTAGDAERARREMQEHIFSGDAVLKQRLAVIFPATPKIEDETPSDEGPSGETPAYEPPPMESPSIES